jgi:hyaluronoglucosaminidase
MYTPDYGTTTRTNEWGTEITVVDGIVTAFHKNNSPIPANGFVLSLHSAGDGEWLRDHAIVGASVSIANNKVTITIAQGAHDIPNTRIYANNVIYPFIIEALAFDDSWVHD